MSKTTKLMNLAAVMFLAAATAAPSVVSANDAVGGDLPPIEAKVKDSAPKETETEESKKDTEKEADKTDSADSQDPKSEATDPTPTDQTAKEKPATEEPAVNGEKVEDKKPAEAPNQDQPAKEADQPVKEDQGKEVAQPEEVKPTEEKPADQGEKPVEESKEASKEEPAKEEPAKEESKEEAKPAEEPTPTGDNLDKAIVNVNLLDSANELTDPEKPYRTVVNGVRRVGVDFDLTGYADKVKDGDYFDLDLPKGFQGVTSTIPLKEPGGKIIGTVKVTEGKARVTLNGIADYIKDLDAEGVKNLKGNFFFEWKATETTDNSQVKFKIGGDREITYGNFTVVKNDGKGYNGDSENYAKIHGVAIAKAWESPTLNIKTTASHNWTLRVNTNMKNYSVIKIKDKIVNSQFIPESFTLRRGSYDMAKVNFEGDLIKYGIDYTVKFLNNYQEFELAINNVKDYAEKGYYLQYASTAPLSGIKVKNVATMEADGEVKKPNDRYSWTVADVERTSRLTEGGEINLEPWKSVKPLDPEKPVNPNPPIVPDPNTPSSEESSSSSSEESSESSSESSSSSSEESSESSSSESSTSSEESSESSSESSSSSSEESSSSSSSEESSSSSEQSSESSSSEESSSSSSSSESSASSEESSSSSSESSSSTSSEESSESSSESSSASSEESSSSSSESSSSSSEESSSSTSSESSSEEGSKPTPSKPEQPKKDKVAGDKLPETGEAENTLIMIGVAFLLFAVAAVMMSKAYEAK